MATVVVVAWLGSEPVAGLAEDVSGRHADGALVSARIGVPVERIHAPQAGQQRHDKNQQSRTGPAQLSSHIADRTSGVPGHQSHRIRPSRKPTPPTR